jgi:hypothetical protein
MKTLLIFSLKTTKTFFVIPWLIVNLIRKNMMQTFSEFYDLGMTQFEEIIYPIKYLIKTGFSKVISTFK